MADSLQFCNIIKPHILGVFKELIRIENIPFLPISNFLFHGYSFELNDKSASIKSMIVLSLPCKEMLNSVCKNY